MLFILHSPASVPPDPLLSIGIPLAGVGAALICLGLAFRAWKHRRLVQDIPTCKTSGVFIGLVELKGTAEAEQPLHSHLAGQRCVHYTWSIEEHWSRTVTETYRDSKGQLRTRTRTESGWKTLASGGEQIPFYLRDDQGHIRIRPEGARIEPLTVLERTCGPADPLYYGKGPPGAIPHSDHRRRFIERAIPLHAPIYVMGQAREREDIVAPEIARDDAAPLFLISTRTEEQVRRGYHMSFWILSLLGLALLLGAFLLRGHLLELPPVQSLPACLTASGLYLAAWLVGWTWLTYNRLVDLRQRVRQAWANVDVQLKRRNDLIPNLVRTVERLRDHEQKLQTELAILRAQLLATPPGQPGPDPHGCAKTLLAVVERYPELQADESFRNLQRNLVDTEQRIALARNYFNDIATFYNSRIQIIPDRFLAALARLSPQPLLTAADFERAPVPITFAS